MTTERYLEEWRTAGLITVEQYARLAALVRRQRFSVFLELNALLYLSVVAGCLWYCFARGMPYAPERVAAPTFSFDYVLYLGCLVFAAGIAYLEYRFHALGVDWHYYLLASAALYFALAYRFDNRFVL